MTNALVMTLFHRKKQLQWNMYKNKSPEQLYFN
jgi:hypothetical protein